jgi:hypothetical protein
LDQAPVDALRLWPTTAVPETAGGVVFDGAQTVVDAVALALADVLPAASNAATPSA